MSVVVVDNDDSSSTSLIQRFIDLHYDVTRGRLNQLEDIEAIDLLVFVFRAGTDLSMVVGSVAESLEHVPGILATIGSPTPEDLILALSLGFTDVIEWPANNETIVTVIDRNRRRSRSPRAIDSGLYQRITGLQRDHRAGQYIPMGMLPSNPMTIGRFRLCHSIRPSHFLSGDFVDYFPLAGDHFVFYIADVSGHGASSSFVTTILKNFSLRFRREYRPQALKLPGDILIRLNREIIENDIDKHVSMFIGIVNLSTNQLHYANAGHFPHPILARGSETIVLDLPGKPIGLFENVSYESDTVEIRGGDNLVLLSDGILEVVEEIGLESKERRLMLGAVECGGVIERLWASLAIDASVIGPDDMTCLMISCER
jgi:sigma-B regulation protein RsbU (phosphoserine phosphatase)